MATLEQEGFRWRLDDGDEDEATWLVNQDQNITRWRNVNTRLRMIINATGDPDPAQFRLEYRKKGTTNWYVVDTGELSDLPSESASMSPSVSPSISPSLSPSISPSVSPSASPSVSPSRSPSVSPSVSPSISPSASVSPSVSPSRSPSVSPSVSPSRSPSVSPSPSPSVSPSRSPSVSPSASPSLSPSGAEVTPDFYDERFETNKPTRNGYDVVVDGELIYGGDTCNSDFPTDGGTPDLNSPSGWGNQCLFCQTVTSGYARYYKAISGTAIMYGRVSIVPTTLTGINTGASVIFLQIQNGGTGLLEFGIYNDAGTYRLKIAIDRLNAGLVNYYSFGSVSINTRYLLEFKYDTTNNLWAWKVNGVAQANDVDSTDPVTSEGSLTNNDLFDLIQCGVIYNYGTGTIAWAIDLVGFDQNEWIGDAT